MPHTKAEKSAVRQQIRASRAARSAAERTLLTQKLTRQLIALTEAYAARSVVCYVSHRNEPETAAYLRWATDQGVMVFLPISHPDNTLTWAVHTAAPHDTPEATSFIPGLYGIPEPTGPAASYDTVAAADLLLIPACAVDQRGIRLGWGKGYYDRFLSGLSRQTRTFAVVNDDEIREAIPCDPHDQSVHGAVTPSQLVRFDTPPNIS